ncbi:hypothetical protein HanHA300_Chr02g0070761 [Helianthus annuus]|nr:hypothetical protein HanHA300_Chr02g0070761 [Helianthus annuus]KAJ0787567.1 hypothetical protein HanOQP8_Chr02g0083861 [Helianthus annuus]KAJ0953274.1 hypothetical protein HanPSC8_Chr02g0081971 [Helianthus annuus]
MGSCSYESMSQISERIFQENQYPEPQFSTNQQTPSGSLNSRSKTIKNAFKKKKNQVFLEGYVEATDEDDLVRAKSLTDEDLDELKGCFDLGFGFSYDEIPELCNTLPALELCYSMSQKFLDDQKSPEVSPAAEVAEEMVSPPPAPIANWKISSPGDHPEEVKARLKYWAQAVACTVKLCN